MPLLHRKHFIPNETPNGLHPDDEVFHCPLTNEIFTNYEEFYERTILCNSLVWSCSITDKPNLTYQEALDCELAARKKLSKVSSAILKPVLYLASLSNQSRIDELNEEIYSFVKERYFVGEAVEVADDKSRLRTPCRVVKVFSTRNSSSNGHLNGDVKSKYNSSDEEDEIPLSTYKQMRHLDASEIRYQVKQSSGKEKVVSSSCIKRKQGVYTRQTSKLFLKAYCIKPQGFSTDAYVVKDKVRSKLRLDDMEWEDIFTGPKPMFTSSPKSQKFKKVIGNGTSRDKKKVDKVKDQTLKDKFKMEMKHAREIEKEEKRKEKEELRKRRAEEMERLKEAARIDKERKKKEKEEEMIKLKVEKENMKHQKLEEKKKLAEYLKEWSRPRDDLECDDLKDLPPPHEINCDLPPSLFGDALSLLEFFHIFGDLFDAADEFPDGVSIDLLSSALMTHKHDGPLCDLFFFFLSNIFRTHSEEEEGLFDHICIEPNDKELSSQICDNLNEETLQAFSTLAATWPITYQGFALNKLELDSYTLTEILRLYLLSSAARPRNEDRLWRFQHRGGYTIMDDAPLSFCLHHQNIVEKLATTSVFDLEPDEKVAILMCLLHHLMSFVAPRDFLDETWEKLQQTQQTYRDDKIAEKRRERESAADKYKFKCEQQNLEKQVRMKELEEKLRRAELGLPEEESDSNSRTLRKRKTENEDDNDEPKLLDPLERKERLRLFDEEETQAKEAWNYRLQKHQRSIDKYQAQHRVRVLGQDRYYRRYWSINSLPGVFVEEFIDEHLTDDVLTLRVPQKKSFPFLSGSGYSTPGMSDSSATATPVGITKPIIFTSLSNTTQTICGNGALSPLVITVGNCHLPNQVASSSLKSPEPCIKLTTTDPHCSPILKQATNPVPLSNEQGVSTIATTEQHTTEKLTQGKRHRWFVYSSPEEIDNLLASLNTRGYRESKLRNRLTAEKDIITSHFDTNKSHLSTIQQLISLEHTPKVNFAMEKCEKSLDILLRDQILDLETRVWAGTLGFIRVGDRSLWRESILKSQPYTGSIEEDTSIHDIKDLEGGMEDKSIVCDPFVSFPIISHGVGNPQTSDNSHESSMIIDDSDKSSSVKDLSIALLFVERGIDRKYLKPPLGSAVDTSRITRSRSFACDENDENAKMKSKILMMRWEASLLKCTSLPQIFLHLSTLERCIMWSRSVLNAKCRICRRKGDAEKMLLCDTCDRGHHMYCLRPALKSVPAGDWYCPDCQPRLSRISPRKVVRTKSFSQDDTSDEDVDTDDDDTEEDTEESDSSEEEEIIEPVKKNLTYKIPQKPNLRSKKASSPATSSRTRSHDAKKDRARKSDEGGSSKRRSTGVWKDLSLCEDILSDLIKHKDSWPFLEPVSKKLVPDYYTIIKNPMDLGTVQKKLKNVEYSSPSDFIADVDLIFVNCREYNDSRSSIAKTSTSLQTHFDSRLNKVGLSNYRLPFNPTKKRRIN